MRFLGLAPAWSWTLLAAAAALVVLFYVLKPAPRRLVVASALVWQRVLQVRRRRPERLRWWLSLLLALVIALSLAFAVTQPEVAPLSGRAADIVLVIDNSATMAARTADGRSRLDLAAKQARRIIEDAGAGSRFMVIDAMQRLGVPAFESRDQALARLKRIAVSSGGRPWIPALPRRHEGESERRIVLVGDGIARIETPPGTQFVSVLRPADNVGITAFDVRAAPADARRHEAFVQVLNGSPGIKQAQLYVVGVGAPPIKRTVQLAGGAAANLTIDVSAFREGPLKAMVTAADDALALDDAAYAYLPSKGRVRVGVVTGGNPALLQSLRLLPRVDVEAVPLARAADAGRFDALVFDRTAPAHAPVQPALLIAPPARPWLPRPAAALGETHLSAWDGAHPLLAGVSLRDVLIEHAQPHALDGSRQPFAAVARGPHDEALILATRQGTRMAVVGFALDASNFARQASFPSFLANAVTWLTREARAQSEAIGQVSVPSAARVLDASGHEVAVRAVPDGALFEAAAPGIFTALTRDQRTHVAVNLFDADVTRINAGHVAPASAASAPLPSAHADPWFVLLVLAALLLAFEWMTYNRRVTL